MKQLLLSLLSVIFVQASVLPSPSDAGIRVRIRYRSHSAGPFLPQFPLIQQIPTTNLLDQNALRDLINSRQSMTTNRSINPEPSSTLRAQSKSILSKMGLEERILPRTQNDRDSSDEIFNPDVDVPPTEYIRIPEEFFDAAD